MDRTEGLEVIAKRGKAAFKPLTITGIIVGIACLGLGLAGVIAGVDFMASGIAGLVIGVLLVVLCSLKFADYAKNHKNPHDCIYFDKEKKALVCYTISGHEVEIPLDDYVTSSCSFGSDLMLMIRFKYEGKNLKLNLGYCENRQGVHDRIIEKK